MCMLYILTPGVKVRKDRGRIRIEKGGQKLNSLLIKEVESIVVGKNAEVSTAVLFEILSLGRSVFYVDGRGRLVGQLGSEEKSLGRFECQRSCFKNEEISVDLIKQVVHRKIGEQIKILKSYGRHGNSEELRSLSETLSIYRKKVVQGKDCDTLRGLEGIASRTYFEGFRYILDQSKWP